MIREYKPEDLERLRWIHARQGFNYPFPDLNHLDFIKRLVVDEDGRVPMAAVARLTTELYLLADPEDGTPQQRRERLQQLQDRMERELWLAGASDMPDAPDAPDARHPPGRQT